jgi:hypothetical protein
MGLIARDISTLIHDPEFQTIADRSMQFAFTKNYAAHECGLCRNGKELAAIYEISVGHVEKLLHAARQRRDAARPTCRRPPNLMEDQEQELVELLSSTAENGHFPTKCAL